MDDVVSVRTDRSVAAKTYGENANELALSLVPTTAKLILDVGCGAGANARVLTNRGAIVDGITLSQNEAERAALICRNVAIHNLESGFPEDLNEQYDVVFCSHVLEHICFPKRLLSDALRSLKPTGRLVIAVPNMAFYRARLAILRGRIRYAETGLFDYTHFRWYTLESIVQLVSTHGFHVDTVIAEGRVPGGVLRKVLPSVWRRLDSAGSHLWPSLFGYQLALVAHKCA